jgi:hypothetical protein
MGAPNPASRPGGWVLGGDVARGRGAGARGARGGAGAGASAAQTYAGRS